MPRPRLYTEDSVERALEVHCPGRWRRQAVGYVVSSDGLGEVHLRTMKEAVAYCIGRADAEPQYANDLRAYGYNVRTEVEVP
jgi:hypothetical protein